MLDNEQQGLAVVHEEDHSPVDLLARDGFVERMVNVAQTLAENKKNACYAINGDWGVGKTFVLDAFERHMKRYQQEESSKDKYIVFHYNCWLYDYYEEPLIALVASMLDQIQEQTQLLSEKVYGRLVACLKIIGVGFLQKSQEFIQEKTRVDTEKLLQQLTTVKDAADQEIENNHQFDSYFAFKKTLQSLSDQIKDIAREQTVIFVVDELDRCMPEYTIKVLERLHHAFDQIDNVQVIIAVDKTQIENTIRTIYGPTISVERYLSKFIQFELKLDEGQSHCPITQLYPRYIQEFAYDYMKDEQVDAVCETLLDGIDIRRQKELIGKAYLCHRLLKDDTKQDRCILCIEIFCMLLHTYRLDIEQAKKHMSIPMYHPEKAKLKEFFSLPIDNWKGFVNLFIMWEKTEFSSSRYMDEDNVVTQKAYLKIRIQNIYDVFFGCYRIIVGIHGDDWVEPRRYGSLDSIKYPQKYISDYVERLWNFLQLIE